jgi:hypothetical protein
MFAQRCFEANHHGGVMVSCLGIVFCVLGGQAVDDGVKHLVLQGPCHLWLFDQFSSALRKMAGLAEKRLKSQRFRARRAEYSARGGDDTIGCPVNALP